MLTKNGKKLIKNILIRSITVKAFYNNTTNTSSMTDSLINKDGTEILLKDLDTVNNSFFPDQRRAMFTGQTGTVSTNSGLYFGTGTAEPTENDYTIDFVTNSPVSIASNVSAHSYNIDETPYFENEYTYTNNSANPITINEFGIFSCDNNRNHCFLVYRDVLDTPITIPSGTAKTIKITFSMNW